MRRPARGARCESALANRKRVIMRMPKGPTFDVIGSIENVETIGVGKRIRILARLQKHYGKGRWRKKKGIATIRFEDGSICRAEVHWYEAHGLGRQELKIKRLL